MTAADYSPDTSVISAVAFDYGGVLTPPPATAFIAYAQELGLPDQTLLTYFFRHPMMAKLEVGEITSREFFKYVCHDVQEVHGVRVDIHRLAGAASAAQVLDPDMIALVEALSRSVQVALVTNNVESAEWRETFPFEHFSVVLDSSEIGHRKPDPPIFHELIERLALPAHEIMFVDDMAVNTEAAEDIGLRTITFTSPASLRSDLAALGLSIDL